MHLVFTEVLRDLTRPLNVNCHLFSVDGGSSEPGAHRLEQTRKRKGAKRIVRRIGEVGKLVFDAIALEKKLVNIVQIRVLHHDVKQFQVSSQCSINKKRRTGCVSWRHVHVDQNRNAVAFEG